MPVVVGHGGIIVRETIHHRAEADGARGAARALATELAVPSRSRHPALEIDVRRRGRRGECGDAAQGGHVREELAVGRREGSCRQQLVRGDRACVTFPPTMPVWRRLIYLTTRHRVALTTNRLYFKFCRRNAPGSATRGEARRGEVQ